MPKVNILIFYGVHYKTILKKQLRLNEKREAIFKQGGILK
jgi:hypothetical protein